MDRFHFWMPVPARARGVRQVRHIQSPEIIRRAHCRNRLEIRRATATDRLARPEFSHALRAPHTRVSPVLPTILSPRLCILTPRFQTTRLVLLKAPWPSPNTTDWITSSSAVGIQGESFTQSFAPPHTPHTDTLPPHSPLGASRSLVDRAPARQRTGIFLRFSKN